MPKLYVQIRPICLHHSLATNTFKPGGRYPGPSKIMIDIAMDNNFSQIVDKPTRDNNILDLCFTNCPSFVNEITVQAGISDHDVVIVNASIKAKFVKRPRRKIFLFNKGDYESIASEMRSFNDQLTSKRVSEMDIDTLWSSFRDTLQLSMDQHIPSKLSSSKPSQPWITNATKREIRKKQRLYKKARKSNSTILWDQFKTLRRRTDRKIKKQYKTYVRDVIGTSLQSENTKPFWNFIKTKKQEVFGISALSVAGRTISSAKEKAETLNNQFCSIFTEEDLSNIPDTGRNSVPDLPSLNVTTPGVEKLLQNLKVNKASGPDNIPARVLKECSSTVAPILQKVFQKSLDCGVLPKDWRQANVSPIFKKGDRSNPANYRPVSLTCISCKLLEHIIHSHIMGHIDHYHLFTDLQHGFRKERSCETQLAALTEDLAKILDRRSQVDLIIMDFSKAFDVVPHQRLLSKLHCLGIRNNIKDWIGNFLTTRQQTVIIDGEKSENSPVTSGVPQGTVLGPLLFLMYINDLPESTTSQVRLFADDCILYREISSNDDCVALQQDIDSLCEWEKTWQMSFNASKCFTMHMSHKKNPIIQNYKMGNSILQSVDNHPYLGVELSKDFSWSKHITQVTNGANKILGLLRRNLRCCDEKTKATAYKTLVRPKLEYCSPIWDPHKQTLMDMSEKVQRRAARFVASDYRRETSVTQLLHQLEWERLDIRRLKARLTIIFKELNQLAPSNIDHLRQPIDAQLNNRHSRNDHPNNLKRLSINKDCYRLALYPYTVPEWNLLPADMKDTTSLDYFKTRLDAIDLEILTKKAHFKI